MKQSTRPTDGTLYVITQAQDTHDKTSDPSPIFGLARLQMTKANESTPKHRPALTIPTIWRTIGAETIEITTLIDTGCSTSLITTDTLTRVTDTIGLQCRVAVLQNPVTLISASGNTMRSDRSVSGLRTERSLTISTFLISFWKS